MKIFHNLTEYRNQPDAELPTCVTLGKFDGFHLGHQKLISRVLDVSRQRGLPSVVFMIRLKDRGILSHKERSRMLKKLGVDILVECTFSRGFMLMSAQEFIQDILADTLHASFVSVGTDFRFGHNRSGDAKVLQEFGEKYNYETDSATVMTQNEGTDSPNDFRVEMGQLATSLGDETYRKIYWPQRPSD